MKITLLSLLIVSFTAGCAGPKYSASATQLDVTRYMGTWYVWAGRTTFPERGAHNAVEKYSWNAAENRVDIDFSFRKGAVGGPLNRIPQTAVIVADRLNTHWKVSPFWPLRFDYLVIAFDPNYEWTAVGVPSGRYLWIMGKQETVSDATLADILAVVDKTGYPVQPYERVEQKWAPR